MITTIIAEHLSDIFWSIMGAGALAGVTLGVKYISSHTKKQQKEIEALKEGMMWMQHDKLLHLCKQYLADEGHIDIDSLENIEGLYKSYKALGGNGTITKLYSRVQDLKIVKDDGID